MGLPTASSGSATAAALQQIYSKYATQALDGALFLDADMFSDLLEACPDLLSESFTLEHALDIFDEVGGESDPGLSLEQFLSTIAGIAEERYPDLGTCLMRGR